MAGIHDIPMGNAGTVLIEFKNALQQQILLTALLQCNTVRMPFPADCRPNIFVVRFVPG